MIRKIKTILLIMIMMTMNGCGRNTEDKIVVGLAWHDNQNVYSFVSAIKAIEAAGGTVLVLPMVRSSDLQYDQNGDLISATDENGMLDLNASELIKKYGYRHSDAEAIMKKIDCLILPGGGDVSPNLYREREASHDLKGDLNYCGERDVSDYLLAQYCLDKDIPLLGICRGMQVLCIVSGARMIQDIGTWFNDQGIEYHYQHRREQKDEYVPHDIMICDHDSLLYKLIKKDIVEGCPSWHHQAVGSLEETGLSATAYTKTEGLDMIEAVERKDRSFAIGVQYHPEVAVRKILDKEENAGDYMAYEDAMVLFKALIEKAREKKASLK